MADQGIVIVGAGLAGLFTALRLAPLPVTVLSPVPLGEGAASAWAQGGIAAAVGEGDTPEAHARDTIAAGDGIVDAVVARVVAAEGPDRVRDLLRYGVPFDRDLEGHFLLSREAAHSAKRVVRVKGDRAGAAIMHALIAAVRATPSIRILEGMTAERLHCPDGMIEGIHVATDGAAGGASDLVMASAVVLATGGIGKLYAVTTNPGYARGAGLRMAIASGAMIADAEFVQFHPTALNVGIDPAPLASEALRGDGATLVNRAGERFMLAAHPDAELAPRDIVARAVAAEIAAGRGAFLDCTTAIGAHFPDEFPTVYASCRAAGIDPVTTPLPVAPAEHYHMGGIATDLNARTSVPGLWAVGEVASTGLHGANRLASNSLLEAVVFAARAAADIAAKNANARPMSPPNVQATGPIPPEKADSQLVTRVRRTMSDRVGVIRNADGLASAIAELAAIARHPEPGLHKMMAEVALFIAIAALLREESRGGHFRSDFPKPRPELAHRSRMTRADALAALSKLRPDLLKEDLKP
jgi:L-aspartate oxidase